MASAPRSTRARARIVLISFTVLGARAPLTTAQHGDSYEGTSIGAAGIGGTYDDASKNDYSYSPLDNPKKQQPQQQAEERTPGGLPLLLPTGSQSDDSLPDYSYAPPEAEGSSATEAALQRAAGKASYEARTGGANHPLLPNAGAAGGITRPVLSTARKKGPRPVPPPPPSPPDFSHSALYWTHKASLRTNALGGEGGVHGTELRIKGVSWFGLESKPCAIGGMEQMPVDIGASFLRKNGFNAVRIPLAVNALLDRSPDAGCLPAPLASTVEEMQAAEASIISPGVTFVQSSNDGATRGLKTNNPSFLQLGYLRLLERFITTLGDYGLLVMLDLHASEAGCAAWAGGERCRTLLKLPHATAAC